MLEDVKKFLELTDYENIRELFNKYGLDLEDGEEVFNKIIEEYRSIIHDEYFSFVDKYVGNKEFFDALNPEENLENIFFSKLLVSDEFYYSFLDYFYADKELSDLPIGIFDVNDLQYFLNKGVSINDIVEYCEILPSVQLYIYNNYPEIVDLLLEHSSFVDTHLLAAEVSNGNYKYLGNYFRSYGDFEKELTNLLSLLSEYDSFDFDKFLDELLTYHVGDKDISVLADENVINNLLKIGGSKALIFVKNPSESLVNSVDFTYYDYTLYDGSYKNSPALLMKFLNSGKTDALMYAKCDAIDENVIDFIRKNNISIERLESYDNLHESFLLAKYLSENGSNSLFYKMNSILTNIDAFEYVYSLFLNNKIDFSNYYRNSDKINFLFAVLNDNWEHFYSYYSFKVSLEVAVRLIEVGLTVEHFFEKLFRNNELMNVFIEAFALKGIYFPLLYTNDRRLIETYESFVTFDLYNEALARFNKPNISIDFVYKFVKEGHYEVLKDYDFSFVSYHLEHMGFDKLTYEEYLALPDYVQNINALKQKFVDMDPAYLMELIQNSPDSDIIDKAIVSGISFDEIIPYMNNYCSLYPKTVLRLLEKGDTRGLKYISHSFGSEDEELACAKLYYSMLNGQLPDSSLLNWDSFTSLLIIEFIKDKRFEILSVVSTLTTQVINELIASDYDFETFKKYPIYDGRIIAKFVSLEKEEELVNYFKDVANSSSYFSIHNSTDLFLLMYKIGFSQESLKEFSNILRISPQDIFKQISEEEYGIFNLLNLGNMSNNKVFLLKILNYLSIDKIVQLLNEYGLTSESRAFIIRKMVSLGHYDFVSYYGDRIEVDVLKRALLGGYFPERQLVENKFFKTIINKIEFSSEELNYLKSKIESDSRFIYFFPKIINDPHLLAEHIKKSPNIIRILDAEKKKNIELLKIVVRDDPKLCCELISYDINKDDLIVLLRENIKLIDFVRSSFINHDVVKGMVSFYPAIIDSYNGYCDEEVVLEAIKCGYVFSKSSSVHIISIALKNNIPLDKQLLIDLNNDVLFKIGKDLISDKDSPVLKILKEVLDYKKSVDKLGFIYDYMIFINSIWYYNDVFREFLDSFEIDVAKYNYYDFSSKDKFLLLCKLEELNKDDSALPIIDELINESNDKKIIFRWMINNLPSSELFLQKKFEYSKRFFLDDPLYYVEFVNVDDLEVVELVRSSIYDYPTLYSYVPSILDNKELILFLIERVSAYSVYSLINDEFKNDLEILKNAIKKDEKVFSCVNHSDSKIIEFARENLLNYPIVAKYIPNLINDKETAIKLANYSYGSLYSTLTDELKKDYDVCVAYLDINSDILFSIPSDVEDFRKFILYVLNNDGSFINRISSLVAIDEELICVAVKTNPDAMFKFGEQFFNETTFSYVTDLNLISNYYLSLDRIIKIAHFSTFDVNNVDSCKFVVNHILNLIDFSVNLNKDDLILKTIFKNGLNSNDGNSLLEDGMKFRKILTVLPLIGLDMFDLDTQKVLSDASAIIASTGKLNTLDKNPIFSYDVVKYIYPLFGLEFVKDVIKYNTPAANVIVNEIKNGNKELLVNYYNIICSNNVFDSDDKRVHYAFRFFADIKPLIIDIVSNNIVLTNEDIVNLKKIITGRNTYGIQTYDDLVNYKTKTEEYWTLKLNTQDIVGIKNLLATLFGYSGNNALECLKSDFNNFQLNNYLNFNYLRNDLIKQYGKDKGLEIFNQYFYTRKDVAIITLMDRVINSENINELKELMNKLIKSKDGAIDYIDDVRNIINKVRILHNYQFNGRLTKIENIKSDRLEKDDPSNPYGVTIIEMDDEKFNFLCHRIYSYDPTMRGFSDKLMADPSLWTKLEGASTLSTSSISDKGFWLLKSHDSSGVIYLFNDLPKNFMLFMNGRDLFVEHGGYKIEPTARDNSFTNIDALNQCSCYESCRYNEVAGFREGVLPCAFACVGDVPNEETIRAAKYFSEVLGVDIPIIKFYIKAYDDRKADRLEEAKKRFSENPNYEDMYNIFFDGIKVKDAVVSIKEKIDYCLDALNIKYKNEELDFDTLAKSLIELESIVSQLIVDLPSAKKELARIGIFRKSLCILKKVSKEDIIRLETAAMGETGIMYKYQEGEKTYLVKPSVDKKQYSTEGFRSDVQEAAYRLQDFLSPTTAVKVESYGGKMRLSKQELVDISSEHSNLLVDWVNNGGTLDYQYSSALLREYVVDFLLCNFDCYVGNFIIDSDDNVRGIDKEQSFRFMDVPESLNPDFSYTPNGNYRKPIYNILFNRYINGEIDLDLSVITDTIEKVKLLSDEDYKAMFRDYAYRLDKYKVDDILEAILNRRNDAVLKMEEYVEKLRGIRKTEGVVL